MEDDRLLRLEEVAQRLARSYRQVRNLISKGLIPYTKIGAKGVRVKKSDLDAYIAGIGHGEERVREEAKERPADKREPFEGRKSYYEEKDNA